MTQPRLQNIPSHVAIIMDGNGRWARMRHKPRIFGHREGANRVREIVEAAAEMGVQTLTLYAFSEENWSRPLDEVKALFNLLVFYLKKEITRLNRENIRLSMIGNLQKLPPEAQETLRWGIEQTRQNTGMNLVLALSYGGRSEIVDACRALVAEALDQKIAPEQITVESFARHLPSWPLNDPDLLIRTSGEQRISNFLLWQLAYTEFVFTPVMWPEFTKDHLKAAVETYQLRQRRFGKVDEVDAGTEGEKILAEAAPEYSPEGRLC